MMEKRVGGYSLTFPITLVEGDNGQVGVDLFNYLFEKYGEGIDHSADLTEELYFRGTSYSDFDGRIRSILPMSSGSNNLVLIPQNNLDAANIFLDTNGVVTLNIYG